MIRRGASRNGPPTIRRRPQGNLPPGVLTSCSRNQNGGSMKVNSTERSRLGPAPGSDESDEHGRVAMQDFTLVIPTYNRPTLLETSSRPISAHSRSGVVSWCSIPARRNLGPLMARIVELAKLKLDYAEFPSGTHPFDKFREGVHKVATEFCALCADDDLVLLDGVQHCLEALRSNPLAWGRPGLLLFISLPARRRHGPWKRTLLHLDHR